MNASLCVSQLFLNTFYIQQTDKELKKLKISQIQIDIGICFVFVN